ncbi:MAG: HIT domain-containing protein [Herpetosiphonaceae bacterium]|nr:HIT domain-containing protein [Herpetosiphonaceae bacterium]
MQCPLCPPAVEAEQVVLENALCLFLQMPEPVLIGAGIIIPRSHRETVFDLTPAEWVATYDLLGQVKALLDASHAPAGYNVGWNSGATGGQHIFHAHLHVIPRYVDEPLAGKGIRHWLKQPENRRD